MESNVPDCTETPVGIELRCESVHCRHRNQPSPPAGLGDHQENLRLYQPHSAPGGPGALAGGTGGEAAASTSADYL